MTLNKTIILDSETTGLTKTDEIIQLAYFNLEFEQLSNIYVVALQTGVDQKFRPSVPINPHASKVNGVQYKDLLKCPPSKSLLPPEATYVVGHNISFDKRMLLQTVDFAHTSTIDKYKLICTKELSQALDKKFGIGYENHKLDTLFAYYFPELDNPEVHDGFYDCIKCGLILSKLLQHLPSIDSFEKLYEFQQSLKKTKKIKI